MTSYVAGTCTYLRAESSCTRTSHNRTTECNTSVAPQHPDLYCSRSDIITRYSGEKAVYVPALARCKELFNHYRRAYKPARHCSMVKPGTTIAQAVEHVAGQSSACILSNQISGSCNPCFFKNVDAVRGDPEVIQILKGLRKHYPKGKSLQVTLIGNGVDGLCTNCIQQMAFH